MICLSNSTQKNVLTCDLFFGGLSDWNVTDSTELVMAKVALEELHLDLALNSLCELKEKIIWKLIIENWASIIKEYILVQ